MQALEEEERQRLKPQESPPTTPRGQPEQDRDSGHFHHRRLNSYAFKEHHILIGRTIITTILFNFLEKKIFITYRKGKVFYKLYK